MKTITTLLLVLLTGMACATERDWALVTDRDDIKVYRAHTDDSLIKTFRGKTEVALEDFRSIAAIMDDCDFVAEWLHMVSEDRGVSREWPSDRTVWLTTRLPEAIRDSDLVLKVW